MSETKSNEGAFACASENGYQAGLTKREYFAGLAMQGLCCNDDLPLFGVRGHAELAVEMSDALIAALNEADQ